MRQKVVLVTGATGLLGRQLLPRLLHQGFQIYATKRTNSIVPSLEKINWIEIKSYKEEIFKHIHENVDYVIHAGAMVSYKKSDKGKIFETNTQWTALLAKEAIAAKVKKFIFISSISALGKNSANNTIDENTPVSTNQFMTNYGKSKRHAEKILWQLCNQGLAVIIFNPSVIIGPAARYQSSAQLLGYVGDQKPFYTKGLINYVDVRNVSQFIISSLESPVVNEQFILNAGSISYGYFFKAVSNQLNVKSPWIAVPKFLVYAGAILENIVSKITGKPPTLTFETAKMAGNKKIYDSEKAKKTFHLSYNTLEESIEWTVQNMQKTGDL